ncbi:MAG: protein kinase domain-containing protein [Romboutsia sp.]|uniref:protein kinase domain-containing protein n=1 Tax=Romboutsia sp. TaxID=1965302 RepID=UPI003F3D37E5
MNFIGNRYELLNIEGHIELNKIYQARDAYNNDKVLIKIIEYNQNICENFISNLIDESTMLKDINSPYILNLIDVGVHCTELTTLYYMVSEYSEGITLESIIRGNYLHLEAIVNIATQVVKALESVNKHNMYHGDLNPTNILLDEWYNVKVCNFGLTKANNGVNPRACGQIKYLSPHQLCVNYTDLESDLFALGIMLFESIFKKLPFEECETEEEMLKKIDKGVNWRELKAINGNEALINIIKKLLDRRKKYRNTQEIIIDLSLVMYEKAYIEDEVEEYEELIDIHSSMGIISTINIYKKNRLIVAFAIIGLMLTMIINML